MAHNELAAYVRTQESLGYSPDAIRLAVVDAGWKERDIDDALRTRSATIRRYSRLTAHILSKSIIFGFAIVGAGLLGTYGAVRWHFTDTPGIIDTQGDTFWQQGAEIGAISQTSESHVFFNEKNYCLLESLRQSYPAEFTKIIDLALHDQESVAATMLQVIALSPDAGLKNASSPICASKSEMTPVARETFERLAGLISDQSPFSWANSSEWEYFKNAVVKDGDVLQRVENETGVPRRILVAQLAAEQMRLFYSDRGWFEKAISPLKVLGSMTKFSWGVVGMKPETAMHIEAYLTDSSSQYYPGSAYEHLLDFHSQDVNQERFGRITDDHNHYYAYLYEALFDKEIIAQWQKEGFSIINRPEILATLYNIGFAHSQPNANPQIGGAELMIAGHVISFGRLAYEFYYSNELADQFPLPSVH